MNSCSGSSRYRPSRSLRPPRSAIRRSDRRISALKAAWTVPRNTVAQPSRNRASGVMPSRSALLRARLPGELLAALVDARVGGVAGRTDRLRPSRRLPVEGDRCPDHRRWRPGLQRERGPPRPDVGVGLSSSRSASTRSRTAAGSGSTSPPTAKVTVHSAGWYAPVPAPGPGQRRGRHPDLQPARRTASTRSPH